MISHCLVNIPSSVISAAEEPFKNGITRDTLVLILAQTLLRIVPNVILNKREEAIPLILSVIRLHTDSAEREKLLQLLFNLKKRPQEDERQLILAGNAHYCQQHTVTQRLYHLHIYLVIRFSRNGEARRRTNGGRGNIDHLLGA